MPDITLHVVMFNGANDVKTLQTQRTGSVHWNPALLQNVLARRTYGWYPLPCRARGVLLADSAARALGKYVQLLERMLYESSLRVPHEV